MNTANSAARILKQRASALARVPEPPATGAKLELIEFRLASERYAVEHRFVREVVVLKELTPIPCTPAFIRGIMNWRGQILALLDIKKFFDLPDAGITDLHSVLVIHGENIELGVLADSVVGVSAIPVAEVQSSLPTLTGIRAEYLKGVTADHLVVLDAARMLGDPKIVVDQEVSA